MTWSQDEMVAAVRRQLAHQGPESSWDFAGAEPADQAVRVIFTLRPDSRLARQRHEPGRFAVDYTLIDLPEGPNTGLLAESPDVWADEVSLDIEEEVDTGGVWRAERSTGPDGPVLLRWQRWVEREG
jgi:hypothetical protein